jgi:hypothetical protein
VHFAVRQTTNRLKALNKDVLGKKRAGATADRNTALQGHAERVWQSRRGTSSDPPPDVRIVSKAQRELALPERDRGTVIVDADVVADSFRGKFSGSSEDQVVALVKVLTAYGLIEEMPYSTQEQLLADIIAIFTLD